MLPVGQDRDDDPSQPERGRWWSLALSAPFVALCIAGVLLLSLDAARHIEALATANSDSSQWSLAQLEVEFGSHQRALMTGAPPDLEAVRLTFDIFYSRFETISKGRLYADITTSEAAADFRAVTSFLAGSVPLIDGDDDTLRAGLPAMAARAEAIRPALRSISLNGVRIFSAQADGQRFSVLRALIRITALTAALVLALAIGVVALWRLMQVSRQEARRRARANHRLRAIVSTALDGIVVTDGEGLILEFNAAAQRIFHCKREDVLGRMAERLLFPDSVANHSPDADQAAQMGRRRVTAIRADGEHFPAELSVTLSEEGGNVLRVYYLRDITRQVADERELVAARDQAVAGERAKARFLAVMSHEMRTPLNGLIGTLELLNDTPLSPEQQNFLRIVRRSGDVLLTHVNDVLDISRLETGRFTFAEDAYDPVAVMRDVAETLRPTAVAGGIGLTADSTAAEGLHVLGDAQRVRQVLVNFAGNAIKFTPAGEVRLHVRHDPDAGKLILSVSDTGIGILPDQVERIFEDFVTLDSSYMRAAEGTGLGLGIARRLVEGMGGHVAVDSAPGRGTTFTVTLPVRPAIRPRPPPEAEPVAPLPGRKVLLVEDNAINRLVATSMLVKLGQEVTEAFDGAEGLERAEQRRYDLILMDISMPRLDGVETTRRIRAGSGPNRSTPIVALTAHALPEDIARFREAGMQHSLTKPITRRALAMALADVATVITPPDPVADAPPVIDRETLDAAASSLGPEVFRTLRGRFFDEMETGLTRLEERLKSGGAREEYAGDIHKLAGSAAVFGATALHAALKAQETRAKRAEEDRLLPGHSALLPIWAQTRQALSAI